MTLTFTTRSLKAEQLEILRAIKVHPDELGFLVTVPPMERRVYHALKPLFHGLKIYWDGRTHRAVDDPTERLGEVLRKGKSIKVNPFSLHETTPMMIDDLFNVADFPEPSDYPYMILEPQAGKGAIARALRERYPQATIHCYEIDPTNQAILKSQGFEVLGGDFLGNRVDINQFYDLIALNPPFNHIEYVRHIKRAQTLLWANGKLAAIVPEALAEPRKSQEFQRLQTMVSKAGYVERNPHEFSTAQVKTLYLSLREWKTNAQAHYDQPNGGYPSQGCSDICQALSHDSAFCEALAYATNYQQVKSLIIRTIERLRNEDLVFVPLCDPYLGQATRESLLKRDEIRRHSNVTEGLIA